MSRHVQAKEHLVRVFEKAALKACASVAVLAAFSPAYASTLLDFATTGNFDTWLPTTGSVEPTHQQVNLSLGGNPFHLTPATGQSMAQIKPIGNSSTSNVDSLLHLASGTTNSALTAIYGSALSKNYGILSEAIALTPGTYTFYWSFAAGDYQPYLDGALFALSNATQTVNTVDVLATVGPVPNPGNTVVLSNYGATQWAAYSFNIATSDTYYVSFASYNWGDMGQSSTLFIGDAAGTVTSGSSSPIDTLASYYLASNLGTTVTPNFKGGTLRVDASGTIPSAFTVEAVSGNTIDAYGNTGVFSGVLSGAGGLTIKDSIGGGKAVFTAANTYTGGTTIAAGGILQIGAGEVTGSIAGNVVDNGTLAFKRSNSITYDGSISGTGMLVQAGAGTLILTGANTYTGGTTIAAGTLQIGNGGTSGSIVGDVTDNGALIFNRSDDVTFANVISGTGSLTQAGAGKLILTGTNAYTGGTTISAGTLQIGDGNTSGSIVGDVADNGALIFNRSDAITFAGAISGTGSLTQAGAGTLILTGANTYTGGTTVSAGTLQIGNGGATGAIAGDVADNGTLVFNRSDDITFANVISGSGSLVQAGPGKLILTSANTYTGGTTVSAGTLQIGAGETTGSIAGNIANNSALTFNHSNSLTYDGVISGTGSVNVNGGGTVILTGANTYTGQTSIAASSTLQIGNGGTTGSIVSDVSNQGILAFNRSDTVTFNGNVTGNGTLVQNGTGKVIVTTNYTGKTIVNSGTLQIGNGASSGTVAGNIVNNATVIYGQAAATTYSGIISGTGGVNVSGGGVVILNGSNTYTGPTTVTAGSLIIGDVSHSSGGVLSGVTVSNNGLVGGYGTIGGNLTASGGIVSPGNSIGTLTVNGNYTQSAAATLKIEVTPTAADKLVVNGTAQLGGTLQLSVGPGSYSTRAFTILSAGSISGTFANVSYTGAASDMVYGIVYAPKEVDLAVTSKASGQIYGDIVTQSLDTAVALNRTTLDRLDSTTNTGWSAWSKTLAGASRTNASDGLSDVNTQLWGIISGVDYGFAGGARLSGVFSYTHNQLGVHDESSKASVDGYFFALAGHIPANDFVIDVTGFLQHNEIDVLRSNGSAGNAGGRTSNLAGGGSVGIGYPLEGGDVVPFARLTITGIDTDAFAETGDLGLSVDSLTRTSVRGTWGVAVSRGYTTENGTLITPRFVIGIENEFGQSGRDTAMTFAGTSFLAPAPTPADFSGLFAAGLTAKLDQQLEFSLETTGRLSANQREGIASFGAKYRF